MAVALEKSFAQFTLHIRCYSCLTETQRMVSIHGDMDVPEDPEAFLELAFQGASAYRCQKCEGEIGRLVGISGVPCHA